MKISNFVLFIVVALFMGAAYYWYQEEGDEFFNNIRNSENKPFMLNQFD